MSFLGQEGEQMAADIRARVESFGLGWWLAFLILAAIWLGFLFGRVDLPLAFVVSAICSVRL